MQDTLRFHSLDCFLCPFLAAPKRLRWVETLRTFKLLLWRRQGGTDLFSAWQIGSKYPAEIDLVEKLGRRLRAVVRLDFEVHPILYVASYLEHCATAVLSIFDEDGMVVPRCAEGRR